MFRKSNSKDKTSLTHANTFHANLSDTKCLQGSATYYHQILVTDLRAVWSYTVNICVKHLT